MNCLPFDASALPACGCNSKYCMIGRRVPIHNKIYETNEHEMNWTKDLEEKIWKIEFEIFNMLNADPDEIMRLKQKVGNLEMEDD